MSEWVNRQRFKEKHDWGCVESLIFMDAWNDLPGNFILKVWDCFQVATDSVPSSGYCLWFIPPGCPSGFPLTLHKHAGWWPGYTKVLLDMNVPLMARKTCPTPIVFFNFIVFNYLFLFIFIFLRDCHWCKIEHYNSWNKALVASITSAGPDFTTLWIQMPNGPNSLRFNLQLEKDAYHRGTLSCGRRTVFSKHIPENELLKCMRGLSVY